MKIEVHHAAAVRNESHSEEDVTISYLSEKLVEIYSQVQLIILNRELKNNEQKIMLYHYRVQQNALQSKKNWPKSCMMGKKQHLPNGKSSLWKKLEYFFLTELKSAKAMKIKVHHTGAVRKASQSEEKTIKQPCMEESKKIATFQTQNLQREWKHRTQLMSKKIMVSTTGAVRTASHSKEHFDWIMVATGNQNKCPPENKHFLRELNSAYAMKIKVQHIGAVRNASQSEKKTI